MLNLLDVFHIATFSQHLCFSRRRGSLVHFNYELLGGFGIPKV
jgi:hypothetical protein